MITCLVWEKGQVAIILTAWVQVTYTHRTQALYKMITLIMNKVSKPLRLATFMKNIPTFPQAKEHNIIYSLLRLSLYSSRVFACCLYCVWCMVFVCVLDCMAYKNYANHIKIGDVKCYDNMGIAKIQLIIGI